MFLLVFTKVLSNLLFNDTPTAVQVWNFENRTILFGVLTKLSNVLEFKYQFVDRYFHFCTADGQLMQQTTFAKPKLLKLVAISWHHNGKYEWNRDLKKALLRVYPLGNE